MSTEAEDIAAAHRLTCSQCSKRLFDEGRTKCFSIGNPQAFGPFFCSIECANTFDPNTLTMAKVNGLAAWLDTAQPAR